METIEIRDGYALDKDLVVDEEAGVVKGIKILGNMTHNGFAYPRDARIRSHEVLGKAKCNWGHHKEVPPGERFGWYSNVRECPLSDCTRADLHYVKDHQHAKQFVSAVKANPDLLGISIYGEAKGTGKVDEKGRKIVDHFGRVSLDIVADNGGHFGLRDADDAKPVEPIEKPATDYGAEGCVKAITDIIAAGGDARAIVTAIEEHITKLKEVDGGGGEKKEGSEKAEETETETKDSLKAKARKECLSLCDGLGIKDPDDTFLSMIVHVPAAEREAIARKYKRNRVGKTPLSGSGSADVRDAAQPAEDWDTKLNRIGQLIR